MQSVPPISCQTSLAMPDGLFTPTSSTSFPSCPLADMYAYWQNHKENRLFPDIEAIDPVQFPKEILGNILILGVEKDQRFVFRLMGTALVGSFGEDLTGTYLNDHLSLAPQLKRAQWAVETGQPYLTSTQADLPHRRYESYHALTLPFGKNGVVTRILVAFEIINGTALFSRRRPYSQKLKNLTSGHTW